MGCDIHIYLEKMQADGNWYALEIGYHPNYEKQYEGWFISGRSYITFSVLAGVRNYKDVEPISRPKGLPSDVSKLVKKESNYLGEDGHSHSYLTFKEILEYDWSQIVEGETLYFYCEDFIGSVEDFINAEKLNDRDLESYRIVFFFDN